MDTDSKMHILQELLTDEFIGRIQMGEAGIKQDSKIQDLVSILPFDDNEEKEISTANN
jgi:hypothetical protein